MYNPSLTAQNNFRDAVLDGMGRMGWVSDPVEDDFEDGDNSKPRFSTLLGAELLEMTIVFKMRRPRIHYRNGIAVPERLKPLVKASASNDFDMITGGRVDLDNLTKFVMDSLNEVVYDDDRQVAKLKVLKVYDSDGDGSGGVDLMIRAVDGMELWKESEKERFFLEYR